jgi:hypothetical protein
MQKWTSRADLGVPGSVKKSRTKRKQRGSDFTAQVSSSAAMAMRRRGRQWGSFSVVFWWRTKEVAAMRGRRKRVAARVAGMDLISRRTLHGGRPIKLQGDVAIVDVLPYREKDSVERDRVGGLQEREARWATGWRKKEGQTPEGEEKICPARWESFLLQNNFLFFF